MTTNGQWRSDSSQRKREKQVKEKLPNQNPHAVIKSKESVELKFHFTSYIRRNLELVNLSVSPTCQCSSCSQINEEVEKALFGADLQKEPTSRYSSGQAARCVLCS